jgi:hypothetical protein
MALAEILICKVLSTIKKLLFILYTTQWQAMLKSQCYGEQLNAIAG